MNLSFLTFLDLVQCDDSIGELRSREDAAEKQKADAIALLQEEEVRHDHVRQLLYNAIKTVDHQELEMKELQDREAQKKKALDMIKSHKEYQSLALEIELLSKKQYEREQALLDSWQHVENMEKEWNRFLPEHEKNKSEIKEKIKDCDANIVQLKANVADLLVQRPSKESKVPAEWLEKYTAMRSRVADPIVEIQDGTCQACSYSVTQQDLARINRRAVIQCRNCYRLLYSKIAMERSTHADENP